MMNFDPIIGRLETEWDLDGFFYFIRQGKFDPGLANNILDTLNSIDFGDKELIPRKLVSLLWYMPIFLSWQVERVREKGGDGAAYERFSTEVTNVLEKVLGTP
jgi:hypothetical protein